MLEGLSGTLVSRDFAERVLPSAFGGSLGEGDREHGRRAFQRWWRDAARRLGPASSVRTLFDLGADPLVTLLGFRADAFRLTEPAGLGLARLRAGADGAAALLVCPWAVEAGRLWRESVRQGISLDVRWCYVFNGVRLRLVDAERTFSRRYLQLDLELTAVHAPLFAVLWGVLHARSLFASGTGRGPDACGLTERVFVASDAHGTRVRDSLGTGVRDALLELITALTCTGGRAAPSATGAADVLAYPLIVLYRILFLLFAEARGLVPIWHPVYRDSYSIAALGRLAERARDPSGLWESLEAITRLAARGCRAGDLVVTPFNGRLFSCPPRPRVRPRRRGRRHRTADARDERIRRVLMALTTRTGGTDGRERIAYGDLGVEQLGAVYERVLDLEPVFEPDRPGPSTTCRVTLRPTGRRKTTGSFYTPRSLTDYLVRRTLHPLVADASPDAILALRVLDPAMGSGAFLVAACRYLASAYEAALVRSGAVMASDVSDEDRAGFRRVVSQRCLYGVDLNPMAVQLARLSLWLATLAANRPLTFLDHNLRVGDSLTGASVEDVLRQPPPASGRARPVPLPLLDLVPLEAAIGETVPSRARIAEEPGDDLTAVRLKERLFIRVTGDHAPLARWRAVADMWCAAAFWPDRRRAPGAGEFWALADRLLRNRSVLSARLADTRIAEARRIAARQVFFHWPLEFPEAFYDERGRRLGNPGFDAVLGNPPWEMLRADRGTRRDRSRAHEAAGLQRFVRASGVYRLQGRGHANLYQLFLERALTLTRHGGRLGLVLPYGLATDRGSAALRQALLSRCRTDALVALDNRTAIFPIHRGYRFVLLTSAIGGETVRLGCRFGERDAAALDLLPETGDPQSAFPVVLSRTTIRRLGGPLLVIPELRTPVDLTIAEKAAARARPLGDPEGWGAKFGRELNATDDRRHFGAPGRGLPVLEGKSIRPFVADVAQARHAVPEHVAARLLDRRATFGRSRLAFREVAAAANARSLIATVLPPGVVTTHTLLCLRTPLGKTDQHALCAMLNSFVVNYLVRQRIGTHVTASIAAQLPVPRPGRGEPTRETLARYAAHLAQSPDDSETMVRLETAVARLYGLTDTEVAHVLASFPLVDVTLRRNVLKTFRSGLETWP